ncbi:MAG: DUF2683 family protein [Nanoarchaeota archaeon]|nr:DUF2683 family protein [Nanoarchaeota archaeon]
MAQNIFNLGEQEEKILGIVKAQHGLKNKNQAMGFILKIYGESFLEPEIRPEYLKKLQRIDKEKGISFRDINELRKIIEG